METPFDKLQRGQVYMYEDHRAGTAPRRVKIVDIMRAGPIVSHVMQTELRTDGMLSPWEMVTKRPGIVYKRISGGARTHRHRARRMRTRKQRK
jgi:hypothetical protein